MIDHPSLQDRVVRRDDARWHGGLRQARPTMILGHGTEGPDDADGVIRYLNTTTTKKASYTYLISRDGTIVRMTPPNVIAYHGGDSGWPNPKRASAKNPRPHGGLSLNGIALGIAWCNRGDGEPLTPAQIESGLWLYGVFLVSDRIAIDRCRMHYEVSPGRKSDPLPAMPGDTWRELLTAYMGDG